MKTVNDVSLPAALHKILKDHPMQVLLQPLLSSEGGCVEVATNPKDILSSLISSYCAQKGIRFEGKYTIYDEKKRPLPLYTTLSALGIENGQTLLIGKEDSSFSVLRQWPIIVAFATIAIGLIGILTISLVYGLKGGEYFDDYGVVMDAGSSKTNTIVYKWRSNKHRGTGRVTQEDNCYAKGGVAKMNPMHLEPVINCAKNVTSVIAAKSLPKTPLFFAATAGMRLLRLTNEARVNEILKQLNLLLPETNLDIKVIEIISGTDEGIYGWITSNFLLKTLDRPQKFDPWEPSTHGALDMGGASMQISYAVAPGSGNDSANDVKNVQLYGQTYSVFSQSNLCFGRDEAENRYNALLLRQKNGTIVRSPCTPKGYQKKITGAQLFQSICANFTHAQDFQNVTFTYVGTSDPDACQKSVSRLLDVDLCKTLEFKQCFKNITNLPKNQKFLAFATYFYTTNFLNISNATLTEYKDKMDSFCSKSLDEMTTPNKLPMPNNPIAFINPTHEWQTMERALRKVMQPISILTTSTKRRAHKVKPMEIGDLVENPYLTQYCFNAQYIYEVLTSGYGLTAKTWKNLEFVDKIAGKDVGWTLGYMINATNIIPEKATPRLISSSSLTVSLVLFILIIFSTAVFLLYTYKKNS